MNLTFSIINIKGGFLGLGLGMSCVSVLELVVLVVDLVKTLCTFDWKKSAKKNKRIVPVVTEQATQSAV
jgi:hypothetical protein